MPAPKKGCAPEKVYPAKKYYSRKARFAPARKVKSRDATASERGPFPIMKLPPEIRNRVYKFVLFSAKPVHVNHALPSMEVGAKPTTNKDFQPALLLANRQIFEEASVVLYGTRDFVLGSPLTQPWLHVEDFIKAVGRANIALIRNMTFEITYCCDYHCRCWLRIFDAVMGGGPTTQKLKQMTFKLIDGSTEILPDDVWAKRWLANVAPILDAGMAYADAKEIILLGDCPKEYAELHKGMSIMHLVKVDSAAAQKK